MSPKLKVICSSFFFFIFTVLPPQVAIICKYGKFTQRSLHLFVMIVCGWMTPPFTDQWFKQFKKGTTCVKSRLSWFEWLASVRAMYRVQQFLQRWVSNETSGKMWKLWHWSWALVFAFRPLLSVISVVLPVQDLWIKFDLQMNVLTELSLREKCTVWLEILEQMHSWSNEEQSWVGLMQSRASRLLISSLLHNSK